MRANRRIFIIFILLVNINILKISQNRIIYRLVNIAQTCDIPSTRVYQIFKKNIITNEREKELKLLKCFSSFQLILPQFCSPGIQVMAGLQSRVNFNRNQIETQFLGGLRKWSGFYYPTRTPWAEFVSMNFKVALLEVDDFPIERTPASYDKEAREDMTFLSRGSCRTRRDRQ